jgi:hypothetical protein
MYPIRIGGSHSGYHLQQGTAHMRRYAERTEQVRGGTLRPRRSLAEALKDPEQAAKLAGVGGIAGLEHTL